MATKTAAATAETTATATPATATTRQHLANAWSSVTPEEKKTAATGIGVLAVGVLIGVLAS